MTTRERYERLRQLFAMACDLDAGRRGEVLDRECAGDPALRAQIEALLARDADAGTFLQVPRPPVSGRDASAAR